MRPEVVQIAITYDLTYSMTSIALRNSVSKTMPSAGLRKGHMRLLDHSHGLSMAVLSKEG